MQSRHFRLLLVGAVVLFSGCTPQAPSLAVNTRQAGSESPGLAPASSSEVLSSAEIIFEQPNPPYTLETLVARLQKKLTYKCSIVEVAGSTAVVRQIQIDTPSPMFLKFHDDSNDLANELVEFAGRATKTFGPKTAARISLCRARLQLMATDPREQKKVKDKSVAIIASPQIDPSAAPVRDVLKAIADTVHGYVFDYTSGKWMYAVQ